DMYRFDKLAEQSLLPSRLISLSRRCVAALCVAGSLLAASALNAAPTYFSYWGLGWSILETQDHVNLFWAVSWVWDRDELIAEIADAKRRGMRAMVHTEFAFWNQGCPVTPRADAAAQWDSFARTLSEQGLLDTVAAFYPIDEPDLCNVPQ